MKKEKVEREQSCDQVVKFWLCALNWSCWTLNFVRLLPRVSLSPLINHSNTSSMTRGRIKNMIIAVRKSLIRDIVRSMVM